MNEEFDFEAERGRWPGHWNENGWPASKSTWRSRDHPQLRVRVVRARVDDVETFVYWDGGPEELRALFTYEPTERWNIDKTGFVYGSPGIDRDGRWRPDGPALRVIFDRPMFGGPDTCHIRFEDRTPFFEPVPDWDE